MSPQSTPDQYAEPESAPPINRAVDLPVVVWMTFLCGLWGFNAIAIKAVTAFLPPMLAAGLRGVVAMPLLLAFGWWRGETMRFRAPMWGHVLAVGLIFALEFVLAYSGARFTSGGHVAIYFNMAPFFVAVGAHFLLPGDRMHAARWAGLVLAFGGVLVLFSDDVLVQKAGYWRGDLLVILAALAWSMGTLYMKRFMAQSLNGFQMLYAQILVSTPALLGAALWMEPVGTVGLGLEAVGILVFQGVVVVFFSYLIWMNLLRVYSASAMQSFTFLTPVWGVLMGVVLLGETVTWVTGLGIALVGTGLYLVNRPRRG